MSVSPILLVHVSGGLVGCLSGAAALVFRKGSRGHIVAGKVFGVSMLTMAAAGVLLAILKSKTGDILGGTLTLYLVATAWVTARRREPQTDILDWGALLFVLALEAVTATWALQAAASSTGMKNGYPPGVYLFLGSIALICIAGDVRLLVRGGTFGTRRIARHLWRMCFALFIAAGSIFLARQQLFPEILRKTGVLDLLTVLPLLVMIFWLLRMWFKKSTGEPTPAVRAYLGGRT